MSKIDVSRETRDRLQTYADCLTRWNTTINLVSTSDISDIWARHIVEGLAVGRLILEHSGPVTDLGSGAGIPGLVAAIATGRAVTLLEADRRKGAFLLEAGRLSNAPVIVRTCRIETAGITDQAVITARALAPLTNLLKIALPMLRPEGVCLFLKGATIDHEIEVARQTFSFDAKVHRSAATILAIHNLRPL